MDDSWQQTQIDGIRYSLANIPGIFLIHGCQFDTKVAVQVCRVVTAVAMVASSFSEASVMVECLRRTMP